MPESESKASNGRLLLLLSAFFYSLFTLLPNSHSLMVVWPWVFIWQVALICPVLWLFGILFQQQSFRGLGSKIDAFIGLILITLIITTFFAEFPNHAIWYSWAALCLIASLYALNYWVDSSQKRDRALVFQGGLGIAFIVVSLSVWTVQTLLPELERLETLRQFGVSLAFDFSVLELRNWAPLGHQNYVAGYLVLILPLLIALAIINSGWQRWLWLGGFSLGVVNLYTTSSRGGWLGLFVILVAGLAILLVRSSLSKRWLLLSGGGMILVLSALVLTNNRLRSLLMGVLSGDVGGELSYRFITMNVGWEMGISHLLTGVGLGNVPWLYQEYLPNWAGYEAEIIYQLHSTPAQLWAELGLWGLLLQLGAVILLLNLGWRLLREVREDKDFILAASLFCAFLGYFAISVTDYQLDNLAISGTLIIYLVGISSTLQNQRLIPLHAATKIAFVGVGFLVAVIIWLVPIHRGWQVSSQGFNALAAEEVNWEQVSNQLTQAHELASWQPYYPYQLGWNLGELALHSNPPQQEELLSQAVSWFQEGLEASGEREFGYTNLGWLQLNQGNPEVATESLARSVQLLPAKQNLFYGLGVTLLVQNRTNLAIQAFTLEALRHPLFITSPFWQRSQLQSVYSPVLENAIAQCTKFINDDTLPSALNSHFHRLRGIFYWWQGNLETAHPDLQDYGSSLSKALLAISSGEDIATVQATLSSSPTKTLLSAWLDETNRSQLLQQAFIQAREEQLSQSRLENLSTTMAAADTFEQWLKENAPIWQYRPQREGFGVNMRQMGGSNPSDYLARAENIPLAVWFQRVFPSSSYAPQLDRALQSQRQFLLEKL